MINENCVRNTRQKALIYEILERNKNEHITAEDIVDILRKNQTPVAKSTVYRYLAQLEADGTVRKYPLADGISACYQFMGQSCRAHYHLMCQKCGSLVHFENSALQALFENINLEKKLYIDSLRTVFYGLCRDCAGAGI